MFDKENRWNSISVLVQSGIKWSNDWTIMISGGKTHGFGIVVDVVNWNCGLLDS